MPTSFTKIETTFTIEGNISQERLWKAIRLGHRKYCAVSHSLNAEIDYKLNLNGNLMVEKLNWLLWLILVILWNFGFPEATPLQDVIVAVILSLLFIIIKLMRSRYLHKIS